MTNVGDIVLVSVDAAPAFFARIEDIAPDVKPEWYQVKMLVLQVPLLVITWILRRPYIDGEEFTMGGRPMRMERIVAPQETDHLDGVEEDSPAPEAEKKRAPLKLASVPEKSKVVSLMDRLKKD